jgi:hypothetical protein
MKEITQEKRIELIKWLCDKSEYYQLTESGFIFSVDDKIELCEWSELKEEYKPNYRDLLQSVIEGLQSRELEIIQGRQMIAVYSGDAPAPVFKLTAEECKTDIRQAKEQALIWIMENQS